MHTFPGFYGWVRDWDVGGTYTDTRVCPDCQGGARLRPEYLAVTLGGAECTRLSEMPLLQTGESVLDQNLRFPPAEAALSPGPACEHGPGAAALPAAGGPGLPAPGPAWHPRSRRARRSGSSWPGCWAAA